MTAVHAPPSDGVVNRLSITGAADMSAGRLLKGAAVFKQGWILAVVAVALLAAAWAAPANGSQLVEFEKEAAVAANGTIPPVPVNPLEEVKQACGSETATWGSELFTTAPSEIKVKNEWADVVPGKEMEISGTITNVVFSNADIPVDHPFSRDFTFNIKLDEPYWSLARQLGPGESEGANGNEGETHEIHVELESGSLLHVLPQREGPASGEDWEILPTEPKVPTLVVEALEGLEEGYIPQSGERIAMKGRWILDCGHNDFHSELHPITFMAFGHQVGSKTVVHITDNPYRVTQLYGFGTGAVNASPKGVPFPAAFEETVENLVKNAIFSNPSFSGINLLVGLERTAPSVTPFKVCAPEVTPGKVVATWAFVQRKGIKIKVKRSKASNCVTITPKANYQYKALQPRSRTCAMPWPWLSSKIAESLDISEVRNNEVETIRVDATGGTFTITYGGETTAPITYNASAKEVQEALEALPVLKPGDITVTGGPGGEGGATPYTLAFGGELAEQSVTPVTTNRSGLTGGAKLASVVVTRPGGALDLRRFILSLIEQKSKVSLEKLGAFNDITKIEEKVALTPYTACLDPLSAPPVNLEVMKAVDNEQAFPYYGEVLVE
jgi:hypothetical protein